MVVDVLATPIVVTKVVEPNALVANLANSDQNLILVLVDLQKENPAQVLKVKNSNYIDN